MNPPPTRFTFYLWTRDDAAGTTSFQVADRRWRVSLRTAHLETLRKAKAKQGNEVLRLETCYRDNLQRLRAMVSDYRT
jgi:hypothetical protein